MGIRVAERWFERRRVDDDITLLIEPHTARLIQCNIWHVRGRKRDLLIDTGLGLVSLRDAARDLFEKPVIAFATHTHFDHTGGMYEFNERVVHPAEAARLANPPNRRSLVVADWTDKADLEKIGYRLDGELLISALPEAGFDPARFAVRPAAPTWLVEEGDVIDLGDRAFEVLHLPGHSPGSVGLWEASTGTLFSGDAIYDGPLLDHLPESNRADYVATMRRLRALPVTVVHGGHDPSFGRERMIEIAEAYLAANA